MSELITIEKQTKPEYPFHFHTTGINIYSFEEAIYHTYMYWKESMTEIFETNFISFIRDDLSLPFMASKLEYFAGFDSVSEQFTSFVSLSDLFTEQDIKDQAAEIITWENRLEWEKLKEQGDFAMKQENYEKASAYYKKALEYVHLSSIYNNLGVAYMKTNKFKKAIDAASLAITHATADDNLEIIELTLIEAYIHDQDFLIAEEQLEHMKNTYGATAENYYLKALLAYKQKNYHKAIGYLEKTIDLEPLPAYIYALVEVCSETRQYEKALDTLEIMEEKDREYFIKEASTYSHMTHYGASINSIQKALTYHPNDAELWMLQAKYHRLQYDLEKAYESILKARKLAPFDIQIQLEYARIQKAQGHIKEYQVVLRNILGTIKKEYRDIINF